jgi:hypothetical protein
MRQYRTRTQVGDIWCSGWLGGSQQDAQQHRGGSPIEYRRFGRFDEDPDLVVPASGSWCGGLFHAVRLRWDPVGGVSATLLRPNGDGPSTSGFPPEGVARRRAATALELGG